jgi:hypothetical protein
MYLTLSYAFSIRHYMNVSLNQPWCVRHNQLPIIDFSMNTSILEGGYR